MNKIATILLSVTLIFAFNLNTSAQKVADDDITVVLPSQSIVEFLKKLLPFEMNLGENFSGSLWVKSIKDFKIGANKISFSSYIYGKDIHYNVKVGKKVSSIALGNVDLVNDWESTFRFDANKKTLYIKPHLKEQMENRKQNQKETIINVLFKAFSGIEYPIDLQEITPITAEFLGNVLTIGFDITSISVANNKFTVKLKPIPQKVIKKTPADKTS